MKKYIEKYGLIRLICMCGVLAIHVTSIYITDNKLAYLINQGSRFSVPIFIILSGVLIFKNNREKEFDWFNFYKRRIVKILIPYLIWTMIYLLFDRHLTTGQFMFTGLLSDYVKGVLLGRGHLYFVVIIIQLYLLYPVIRKAYMKNGKITFILCCIVTLYFQVGVYLFRWYIYILPKGLMSYYYILFPSWLFYFVLGMHVTAMKKKQQLSLKLVVPLWLLSFGLLIADSMFTNTYGSSIKPTVMIYSIISFLLMDTVLSRWELKSNYILRWMDKESYLFYLMHVIFLKIIRQNSILESYRWSHIEGIAVQFVLYFFITYLCIFLLSYIPWIKYLGGSRLRRNKKNHKPSYKNLKN